MLNIRRVEEADWAVVRSLRLTALREAPEAFGSTYAIEAALSEQHWRSWADAHAVWVAFVAHEGVGMVVARWPHALDVWELRSTWVAPDHRQHQVGRALVRTLVDAAWAAGVCTVKLGVVDTNKAAQGLYEACGFVATGDTHVLAGIPPRVVQEMALELRRRAPVGSAAGRPPAHLDSADL